MLKFTSVNATVFDTGANGSGTSAQNAALDAIANAQSLIAWWRIKAADLVAAIAATGEYYPLLRVGEGDDFKWAVLLGNRFGGDKLRVELTRSDNGGLLNAGDYNTLDVGALSSATYVRLCAIVTPTQLYAGLFPDAEGATAYFEWQATTGSSGLKTGSGQLRVGLNGFLGNGGAPPITLDYFAIGTTVTASKTAVPAPGVTNGLLQLFRFREQQGTTTTSDQGMVAQLANVTWAGNSGTVVAPPLPVVALGAFGQPTQAEGDSGSTAYTATLSRSGDTSGTSSVDFAVAGRGAHPVDGADFAVGTLPGGTVTFGPGETTKQIVVLVAGDTQIESDEGFTLALSNAVNCTLGTASTDGTITNDDTTPPAPVVGIIRGECTDRRGVPLNGLEFPVDSSDPSVCTVPDTVVVDEDGTFEVEVTGVGAGSAIVQVLCGDVVLATPVTVS